MITKNRYSSIHEPKKGDINVLSMYLQYRNLYIIIVLINSLLI